MASTGDDEIFSLSTLVSPDLKDSFFGQKYFVDGPVYEMPDYENLSSKEHPIYFNSFYDEEFYRSGDFINHFPSKTAKPLTAKELELFLLNLNNHIQVVNGSLTSIFNIKEFYYSVAKVLKIAGILEEEQFSKIKTYVDDMND